MKMSGNAGQHVAEAQNEFSKYKFIYWLCCMGVVFSICFLIYDRHPFFYQKELGDDRLISVLKGLFIVLLSFLTFSAIGASDLTHESIVKVELRLTGVSGEMYVFAWSLVGVAFGGLVLQPLSCAIGSDEVVSKELKDFSLQCLRLGGGGAIFLKTIFLARFGLEKFSKRPQ